MVKHPSDPLPFSFFGPNSDCLPIRQFSLWRQVRTMVNREAMRRPPMGMNKMDLSTLIHHYEVHNRPVGTGRCLSLHSLQRRCSPDRVCRCRGPRRILSRPNTSARLCARRWRQAETKLLSLGVHQGKGGSHRRKLRIESKECRRERERLYHPSWSSWFGLLVCPFQQIPGRAPPQIPVFP